jgi:DNA-binding winged helix-turn-helix (wHTH) protein
MKFIINKRVIFHEDNSTLELLDDTLEPVMLTATLCRVLSLLVKNNNLLLTREFLLSNAWDEYGKSSSNSNLNNYISMIRKIFTSFGESDIIVTVPRQGFMFSAGEVNTVEEAGTVSPEIGVAPAAVVEKKWKPMELIALPLLAVALIMVTTYLFFDKYDPVVYHPMGKVGSCTINFLTASHYVKHVSNELDVIKSLIESAKFNCNIPATIYYFNSQMLVSRAGMKNAIFFLSYCPSSRPKGVEIQCENTHEIINKN